MVIDNQAFDGGRLCKFEGELTLWEAADTWRQASAILASADKVAVDLANVNACDGAGIQIICQMWQTMQADGKDIRFEALSEPVYTAMQQAGMDAHFFVSGPKEV